MTMQLIKIVLLSIFLTLIEANYIRVNNTGIQNFVLILILILIHPPEKGIMIEAGNFTEIVTLNEWQGSLYTYPEECLTITCDYPVTKVSLAFEHYVFHGFYDFLMVDLNGGFNVPASVKSLTNSDCDIVSCDVNLLELCSEQDQIKNDNAEIVSCKTSAANYQEFQAQCPQALVDGSDLNLGICFSNDYEVTFG